MNIEMSSPRKTRMRHFKTMRTIASAFLLATCGIAAAANAALCAAGPIPQHVAERFGLARAWFSQADVHPTNTN